MMKRWIVPLLLLFALVSFFACQQSNLPLQVEQGQQIPGKLLKTTGDQVIPGHYIVVLRSDISRIPDVASEMAKAHAATVGYVYRHAIKGFSAAMSDQAAARLAKDPRVKFIEPDQWVSVGKPAGKGKPPKKEPPQVVPWGVQRVGGPVDGTGKTVWVIDTGVDLDHPDLNVDVSRSANFVPRGKDSPDDGNGHGTHVAGIIAAKDNAIDVVGVAAGATVVAVRVLDNRGSGAYSWVIAGVDYVAQNAAPGDVANMSLGGPPSDALDSAVQNAASKGIKFSIAAGNDSDDANNYSPARVNGTDIVTISAIDDQDVFASFSNYGNPPIDWAAPGVSILSLKKGGGVTTMSGTSMAAPHVAGLLLVGPVSSDGTAINDPDGNPDPIAHH